MSAGFPKALAIVAGALAAILAPPQPISPSAWAAQNLNVPDGPSAGQRWSPRLTPYLVEPLDMLGHDSPVNEIAVMKSAQTGFTTLLIAAIGHSIDLDPCRMMLIQPTDSALAEFNREKLDPAIKGSPTLSEKVEGQKSRSGEGSTTYSKKYRGGSLTMAIGSSSADLRSKTIKKLFRDEIDEYPDDLNGQGDPLKLSDDRQTSFLAGGEWKRADISTPTLKGKSKIERRYEGGDRRRWHVPCPHCESEFVFEYGQYFRYKPEHPFGAYYVAPCCGAIIRAHERDGLVAKGRWVATAVRPGAYPSYHFDALSSPFVPWNEIAKRAVEAEDDPLLMKVFYNNTLGLPYEMKGDAPDFTKLMERRESLTRGEIPPRGLILVGAADVQAHGIWVSVFAFAQNRESWLVDAFYCEGSTENPGSLHDAPDSGNAFSLMLQKTVGRDWPDAFGRTRKLDALGIDSGFRSHVVYATVRNNQRLHSATGEEMLFALDGRPNWGKPPIGSPSFVNINLAGQRLRRGAKLWPVGTWPLKAAFYSNLWLEGLRAGALVDPPGYVHFPEWTDENYFRQITSEYLDQEIVQGKAKKYWKLRPGQKDNHQLDAAVYCMALAEHLGLSSLSPHEWAAIAKERGQPPSDSLPLFRRAVESPAPAEAARVAEPARVESVDERLARLMKTNAQRFGA